VWGREEEGGIIIIIIDELGGAVLLSTFTHNLSIRVW